ncbi:MAG: adenylyltransferase/cytidyltransferase family protein [Verrucomicrobiota bacterium]|nr:adenylyltransferase/cytidyltransferase family protein [Verrucomicrobiota bacterium]
MKKVFISGCYDIIHGGHVEFFSQARALGDYLVVSIAGDNALLKHKGRRPAIPVLHKKRLIENLEMVDEVIISDETEGDLGLNFYKQFLEIKPQILAVTDDDQYEEPKRKLCEQVGAEYIRLPKTLNFEQVSTSGIIRWVRAPHFVPLRVDFAGGWLDVPKFSRPGGRIVNCAISPLVSLNEWQYQISSGLGSSAAYAILMGSDGVGSELDCGVGWQDPVVISETGLCVWESGQKPKLLAKFDVDYLRGKMALYYTGKTRKTPALTDKIRDFDIIYRAGQIAEKACYVRDEEAKIFTLGEAVNLSYEAQIKEGMDNLPVSPKAIARKYCGGGWGGYALYLFANSQDREEFVTGENCVKIEPYMRSEY